MAEPMVVVWTTAYLSCTTAECEDEHEFSEVDESRSGERCIPLEPWCVSCEGYYCDPGDVGVDGTPCAPSLVADATREIQRQYVTEVVLAETGNGPDLRCSMSETVYVVGEAYDVERSVTVSGLDEQQIREVFAALTA